MAAFDTTRPFADTATSSRVAYLIVSAFGTLSAWNDARLTRKSLGKLTDRELDDIGLVRSDIEEVSHL